MRTVKCAAALSAAMVTLAVAACGDSSSSDTASSEATTAAPMMSNAAPASSDAMMTTFGAGCAAVPTDASNAGSFQAMAKVPVATAASGNPLLSTLVSAVKQAGLVDTLNSATNITVFAPTNDAFKKIPAATLKKVLADKKTLTSILTTHVVGEQLTPMTLPGTHKTLQGGDITVAGSGTDFTVNDNAKVVCGNVQTANATVYIIDTVLMPKG